MARETRPGGPSEDEVTALARQIADLGAGEAASVFKMSWWSERMLAWAMADPAFRTQLFRLVDVFPATTGDADALRHLHEYFGGPDAPRLLDIGVELAEHVPLGEHISAAVARHNIARMAEQFIIGSRPADVAANVGRLWRAGRAATVDLLGEKTVTAAEADRYASRLGDLLGALLDAAGGWPRDPLLEADDLGPIPRVSVSVKPSALSPSYAPLTRAKAMAEVAGRLRPLLRLAAERGAQVWFDMEHYDTKDLTVELFRSLMSEPDLASLDAGIVLQAYLRETERDLAAVIEWSFARLATVPGAKPIGVRLVKGAYWDTESVQAMAEGWPVPVFVEKVETDASYERCTAMLLGGHGKVRAAFGSHNLRSLAYAVAMARGLGIPDDGYELQMLYGMAEPVHAAVRRLGLRLRVYAPAGELVPGMSYLVRRLLENTANESFVRMRFAENRGLDELLAPPERPVGLPLRSAANGEPVATEAGDRSGESSPPRRRPRRGARVAVQPGGGLGPYRPEPRREWRSGAVRSAFAEAVAAVKERLDGLQGGQRPGMPVPGVIGGERVTTSEDLVSLDPSEQSRVVATAACCGQVHADRAVATALAGWETWRRVAAPERAAVLVRAADWLRSRRDDVAALEVFEAGKPWADADADVCEAIDFCEYYSREMLRLDAGGAVQSPPGEANSLRYAPRGVGAVISPWNFPLAIPMGMVAAALVTGNTVVLKPAEQAPAVASVIIDALIESGLPPGALCFVPGPGEVVGSRLVEHADVAFVAFTGSRGVGLEINAAAARLAPGQRQVKRVLAEMGGKNAIVVDSDADLDQAVPAIVHSAFGYAGQKCSAASRLVVLEEVADEVVARVAGAARELVVGRPRDMGVAVGPVIDAEALERVRRYVAEAPACGRIVLHREDVPEGGYFAGPVVVDDVAPGSLLATEEIFGPVLAVQRAHSFDHALELASSTDYALTAGVFSRSPSHIARAAAELRAGNVYVNRAITGAVPGRQPFGGYGLSGIGSKAGGPDYLQWFLDPRVVSENTLRKGFAPGAT